eukprot:scaffold18349_cov50-Attheya_sp.AAC.2
MGQQLTTNKPAINPVTANFPVRHDVVTKKFTTISTKTEVTIEDKDHSSSTILPDPPSSEVTVKTPPFRHDSHSDAYGGTCTVLVHLKFSTLPDHKEKLLLHDPTMITSSVASKEYNAFSNFFALIHPYLQRLNYIFVL